MSKSTRDETASLALHKSSLEESIAIQPQVPDHTTPKQDIDVEKQPGASSTPIQDEAQAATPEPHSVFTKGMKIWIMVLVSISSLISPFGATTFLPALNILTEVLNITPTQVNISITTYMLAQAFAPAFIGALSDARGRRVSFIVCFIIFIVGNIGLALQTNYIALLLLRMVQAVGCTATIALTFAVVADIATSAERGVYMGYAGFGILMGPSFGPTIGGVLVQYTGWRSVFWFLAIFSGTLLIFFIPLFPETCRKVVGNGSIPPTGIQRSLISWHIARQQRLKHPSVIPPMPPKRKLSLPDPLATFKICLEKESGIILLYNGLFFTGMMVTVSVIPYLYGRAYHLSSLDLGLCYIANGTGALISSISMGHVVDWNFRRHAKRTGLVIVKGQQQDLSNFDIERVRLEIVLPGHVIGIIGLLVFGWTVNFRTHIAFPELGLFIIGFGISTAFNLTNGLLIELHKDSPAAATAAVNFVRCLMSAGGTAAIIPMCEAMTVGGAFTFMAGVFACLVGVIVWVMRKGMGWRQEKEVRRRKSGEEGDGQTEGVA